MYALKCSVNGEVFKTTFDKSSLPIAITFQEGNVSCGLIMVNPNNEREINIGGFGKDRSYALADGTLNYEAVAPNDTLEEQSVEIEIVPYETDGDELSEGIIDVYSLVSPGILKKTIHSCAYIVIPAL